MLKSSIAVFSIRPTRLYCTQDTEISDNFFHQNIIPCKRHENHFVCFDFLRMWNYTVENGLWPGFFEFSLKCLISPAICISQFMSTNDWLNNSEQFVVHFIIMIFTLFERVLNASCQYPYNECFQSPIITKRNGNSHDDGN